MSHGLYNLTRYDLERDAASVAEIRADLYGDEYAVVECGGGLGFAVIRVADLSVYGIQPWQVRTSRCTDLAPEARRQRLSKMLVAATSSDERVAS